MIIGFGSTEQAFEDEERKAFELYVAERYSSLGCQYITDELVADVSKWLADRAAASQAKGDEYKTAKDFPSRYTYFWARVIAGPSDIIAKISFHHINRRHAFSPDGWALMQTKRLFGVDSIDLDMRKTEAA